MEAMFPDSIKFVLCFALFCSITALAQADCRGGQVWKDCGSPCTKTCDDLDPACIEVCEAKCECPPEFPIWDKHTCIEEDDCKTDCRGGQVWKDCGSPCTKTCDDPDPGCIEVCEAKCECPPEFPIWDKHSCIEEDECKMRKCPRNLVWNQCGSACRPTCDNPDPQCRDMCRPQCECPPSRPIPIGDHCISVKQCHQEIEPCQYGGPLEDNNGVIFCGRGPGRQDCQPNSHCVIDPLDRYAVCCVDGPQF